MSAENDAQHEHHFENAESGAALTYPMQCSALRKNGFVVMKGRPCKIIDMSTSKTGKHGHAKVNYSGIDLFNGRKYEDMSPSTHNVDVPHVKRQDYELVDITDGFLSLMDESGEMKEDVKLTEGADITKQIEADFEEGKVLIVTILTAMGEEGVVAYKEAPKGE
ncbi:translation initiation factor eIF5A [Coemansia erecta]|uniref:Eukaryotic translation initiation factor 5A n=1 Tax=Coemansia asiatica TaxID=1052880 RepID=A0A9W8CJN4_9FUNG|nr:translation initiation factor eIF5A [Coemansia asiatica]KAJ2858014.1 translation initiation factor eIF5A [Coemansia erecta]